jgi:hypothetical protein
MNQLSAVFLFYLQRLGFQLKFMLLQVTHSGGCAGSAVTVQATKQATTAMCANHHSESYRIMQAFGSFE